MSGAVFISNAFNFNHFETAHGDGECTHHMGYHYLAKAPDMNNPGHKEFWACCICNHQYLEKPEGEFITRADEYMIGGLDENHIAYLPPSNSGGSDGDYWITDPFEDEE